MSTITVKNNGSFDIAIGRHRKEQNWKNKQMQWSELLKKLSVTHRTAENYSEYIAAKKPRQDEIKDIGGFVGGLLANGRRKNGSVVHRQLLTLDLDFAKPDTWEDFQLLYGNAACIYSTHKHTTEAPRLRLIMPLDREVMSDEYVAIARSVAGNIGIEDFDPTGFRPTQLMYWPSTAKDADFVFEYQDGEWLNADEVLASYHNWQDASEWPMSDREKAIPLRAIKKQGDPLEKTGIVGAWCRTYSISEAIENFLGDAYEQCDVEGRYSYKEGSTAAGLVVYEDKYAYSHHGTDPVSGKLCNAFDLVRLHKFGLKDEDVRDGTPGNKLPSYTEMIAFASKDKQVIKQIGIEKLNDASEDFSDEWKIENGKLKDEEIDTEWLADMDADKKGNYHSTVNNILLILKNDPNLKGRFALDAFEHREIATKNLPWRKVTTNTRYLIDKDDSGIRYYIEKIYGITGVQKILDGMAMLLMENSFHPVKDYLLAQQWDGEERVDSVFIDYMGATDCDYTRAVTRKWFVAAVARIMTPGIKFDYMPMLIGEQGQKKSMLIDKLGRQWYSDSFATVQGKEAYEQIQGVWIVEVAELAALRQAEVEAVKHFISKREDRFRVSYGRRTENFPRQCVFIGSTNKKQPLRDPTGGRRFWPVTTYEQPPTKDVFKDLTDYEIGQIWAEAVEFFNSGEPLFLSKELELEANRIQHKHSEEDDRTGLVHQYLETELPDNWDKLDVYQRREWLRGDDELQPAGNKVRDRVCIAEIWCEVLGGQQKEMTKYNTKDLHEIMKRMQGWKEYNGKLRFSTYGVQKAYVRNEKLKMENGKFNAKSNVAEA